VVVKVVTTIVSNLTDDLTSLVFYLSYCSLDYLKSGRGGPKESQLFILACMTTPLSNVDLPHLRDDNRLSGQNYLQCTQFCRHKLKGRDRFNHVEREAISQDNPNFQIWNNDDSRIITWLRGSITTKISRNHIFLFQCM